MGHSDVLKQLCPLTLLGDHDGECAVDGAALDRAQAAADLLASETFSDTSTITGSLVAFERVFGIVAPSDSSVASRRAVVQTKQRERGGLSIPYYIGLAAALGYSATITEGDNDVVPFRAGVSAAGDAVYVFSERWTWTMHVEHDTQIPILETIIEALKPAWTTVEFQYNA